MGVTQEGGVARVQQAREGLGRPMQAVQVTGGRRGAFKCEASTNILSGVQNFCFEYSLAT